MYKTSMPGEMLSVQTGRHESSPGCELSWDEFCKRYGAAYASNPRRNQRETLQGFLTVDAMFRTVCEPSRLADVNGEMLERFVVAMISDGAPAMSVQRKISVLRIALAWGFDKSLIDPNRFGAEVCGRKMKWQFPKSSALTQLLAEQRQERHDRPGGYCSSRRKAA